MYTLKEAFAGVTTTDNILTLSTWVDEAGNKMLFIEDGIRYEDIVACYRWESCPRTLKRLLFTLQARGSKVVMGWGGGEENFIYGPHLNRDNGTTTYFLGTTPEERELEPAPLSQEHLQRYEWMLGLPANRRYSQAKRIGQWWHRAVEQRNRLRFVKTMLQNGLDLQFTLFWAKQVDI